MKQDYQAVNIAAFTFLVFSLRIILVHVVVELQYDVLRVITEMLTEEAHTSDKTGIFLDPDLYTDKTNFLNTQGIDC